MQFYRTGTKFAKDVRLKISKELAFSELDHHYRVVAIFLFFTALTSCIYHLIKTCIKTKHSNVESYL